MRSQKFLTLTLFLPGMVKLIIHYTPWLVFIAVAYYLLESFTQTDTIDSGSNLLFSYYF